MTTHSALKGIAYFAKGLFRYIEEDHCFLLAAGIAFNVLYCILPLSLVIFYFFSATLASATAVTDVVNYLTTSLPLPLYQNELRGWLTKELTTIGQAGGTAGIIGAVALFWLASILFSTLRTSLNAILNMPPHTNAIIQKLRDFFLMIVVLVLLLGSTFLSPLASVVLRLGAQVLPGWVADLLNSALPRVISLALSLLLYLLLFWMLPHRRLSWRTIAISTATTVLLTEGMKVAFSYYLRHMSTIGTLYGTYAFLVGISLWVYYASLAFLIGGEVGWLYRERFEMAVAGTHTPETDRLNDPGMSVLQPATMTAYEEAKHNPTKPAGDQKP